MLDEDIGTLEIRNEIYFITQYVVMLNIVIIRIYCTSHILIPLYMQLSSICTFKCHAKLNKPLPIRAQYFNRSFINWQSSSQLPNAYCAQLSKEHEKIKAFVFNPYIQLSNTIITHIAEIFPSHYKLLGLVPIKKLQKTHHRISFCLKIDESNFIMKLFNIRHKRTTFAEIYEAHLIKLPIWFAQHTCISVPIHKQLTIKTSQP